MEQQILVNQGSSRPVSRQDIGRTLSGQRLRVGLGQSAIAKKLGYVNVNFISMIESGTCKIPVNRIDALVAAYQLSPEFSLVILKSEYPDFLETILRLSKAVPRIFKDAIKNPDEEIFGIFQSTRQSLNLCLN